MQRALLLIAGLLAGLVCAEVAVRVLDVPPVPLTPLYLPSYQASEDPVLLYEYRPNLRVEDAPFDALHRGFTTNAQGFRDVEFPVQKPAGELRILALGDSITAGNGVSDLWQTWPKRLERRFAQAGRPEVRVLNLGVGGYHPLQAARLLETRGLALAPDLVVLLVCLNDLDAGADGGIRGLGLGSTQRDPLEQEPSDPLGAGLALLARIAHERALPTMVFLLPGLAGSIADYPHAALHARMRAIAEQTPTLPWIDLLDDFRQLGVSPRRLTVDGLHPNRAGAAVLAEIIFRYLEKRELP
jgi:lysophospholipase L1-like esterase